MAALRANETLWECLQRCGGLNLPAWYLGAGCVAQTIWNLAHGKSPGADILDYDLVYYDRDLSEEGERATPGSWLQTCILTLMSPTRRAFISGTRSGSAIASSRINRPRTRSGRPLALAGGPYVGGRSWQSESTSSRWCHHVRLTKMMPPASIAPYNIRVNPPGGARACRANTSIPFWKEEVS